MKNLPCGYIRHQGRRHLLKTSAMGAALGVISAGLLPAPAAGATAAASDPRALYRRATGQSSRSSHKALATPSEAVSALRRLSFGLAPGDLDYFNSLGGDFDNRLNTWLNEQLTGYQPGYPPSQINDPDLYAAINAPNVSFETLNDSLTTLWQERWVNDPGWPERYYPTIETQRLAFARAAHSRWQLAEILADFWHTHFSVDGMDFEAAPTFVHYDRDVIRPHMLGNFRALLQAVTKSTTMMYYLDNASNTRYGPNENFARELQELHTLGAVHSYGFSEETEIPTASSVQFPGSAANASFPPGMKAGYTEADVAAVTRALTGWTISNAYNDTLNTGEYLFHSPWHDFNNGLSKRILGVDIPSNGEQEVHTILDMLAMHPNTARYICTKLCRRLIADDPPASLVEAAAFTFNHLWDQPNQLAEVLKTIVLSTEFKDPQYWGSKLKRPFETVAGAMRVCGLNFSFTNGAQHLSRDHDLSQVFAWNMNDTGHMPFTWLTPDGFPDTQQTWSGSTPLVMTWRCLNWLSHHWDNDDRPIDVVSATHSALPSPADHSANKLVDYWVERVLSIDPATASFQARRNWLVDFMRQNANADTPLLLNNTDWDNNASLAYVGQRLQTLVASICMLPENLLR